LHAVTWREDLGGAHGRTPAARRRRARAHRGNTAASVRRKLGNSGDEKNPDDRVRVFLFPKIFPTSRVRRLFTILWVYNILTTSRTDRVTYGRYYSSRRRSVAIARAGRRARAKRLFRGRARRVAGSPAVGRRRRRRHRCALHRYHNRYVP